MAKHRDDVYLRHIFDACKLVESYIKDINETEFLNSNLIQDAVVREIEVIGEAAKNVSPEFRNQYPEIPWIDVVGMRNKLIHEYFAIDYPTVWNTATKDVVELKAIAEKVLEDLDEGAAR